MAILKNFPPMLIQVGTREVLLDDSKKLANEAESLVVMSN